MSPAAQDEPTDDEGEERPSKSARKRAAHAVQDLGETLIGLRPAQLQALNLPEALAEAVRAARNITSRAAGARQRQYIGKLMRSRFAQRSAHKVRSTRRRPSASSASRTGASG